jgi:predicted RNA binding protein YcfA (HicA-like mRNA interferase family)
MPKLPPVSGPEAVAAFGRAGFVMDRIKGSHHIMVREGWPKVLSVPVHGNKAIAKGTLRGLIRDAGLTVAEFIALLD